MNSLQLIQQKLEQFLSRYYLRQLLKGACLFLFFGGLLVLFVIGLEYMLWMGTVMRSLFFWLLIALLLFWFARYLLFPALQLFRLRRGLSHKDGAEIIGKHFPEVGDRLYNLLDLSEQREKTELLLASIEQRSGELKGIPFGRAVSYTSLLRYARYVLIPVGLTGLLWLTGKGVDFWNSYDRVVHHTVAFEPPAPFQFELLNKSLKAPENVPFTLRVRTAGSIQPESVRLMSGPSAFVMEDRLTHFEYTFRPPPHTPLYIP